MINRKNWQIVNKYLVYRSEIDQLSDSSVRLEETWLRHLLEWVNEHELVKAPKLRPSFPQYVLTARLNDPDEPLKPIYVNKIISAARRFFTWLRINEAGYSRSIKPDWLNTLKAPRQDPAPQEHEIVTLEEIRAMAKAPTETMREMRVKAAAVFLYLSGMRVGAFVTLPLAAVDIQSRTVKQWPALGVKTKFKKQATTYLLNIPDLLDVVSEWDNRVRDALPNGGFWFAVFSPKTGDFDPSITEVGKHRHTRVRKDLKTWLDRVGLEYHSPHKFRHGHAVYALKQTKDTAELKAVSMNLMHSSIKVTDGVYGVLSEKDVREKISQLGMNGAGLSDDDIEKITERLARKFDIGSKI
jgi:site-specific recombinase XerD